MFVILMSACNSKTHLSVETDSYCEIAYYISYSVDHDTCETKVDIDEHNCIYAATCDTDHYEAKLKEYCKRKKICSSKSIK